MKKGDILLFRLSSKSSTYSELPAHLSEDEPGLRNSTVMCDLWISYCRDRSVIPVRLQVPALGT